MLWVNYFQLGLAQSVLNIFECYFKQIKQKSMPKYFKMLSDTCSIY